MSLYPPYLVLQVDSGGKPHVRHNCNGGVQFDCWEEITEKQHRLLELAIDEGKRRKAKEICQVLDIKK